MKRFVLFALVVMIPLACSTQPPSSKRPSTNYSLDTEPAPTDRASTDTAKDPEEKKPAAQDGWVQLFNGDDLSNWKPHEQFPGNWHVQNGILVGKPDAGKDGYLFSERGEYRDFHLKMDVKISDKAVGALYFRAGPPGVKKAASGFAAQINSSGAAKEKTGSLITGGGVKQDITVTEQLVPPDTWANLEVHANGKSLQIYVDGKKTIEYKVTTNTYSNGYLALQIKGSAVDKKGKKGGSTDSEPTLYLRKLEIKG